MVSEPEDLNVSYGLKLVGVPGHLVNLSGKASTFCRPLHGMAMTKAEMRVQTTTHIMERNEKLGNSESKVKGKRPAASKAFPGRRGTQRNQCSWKDSVIS